MALNVIPFSTLNVPTRSDEPYEILGMCDGTVVRGFNALRQFVSNIKSVFGAGLGEMETIVMRLRRDAIQRCIESAIQMGADEVVGLCIDVSEISRGADADALSVVYVYGTAIRYKHHGREEHESTRRSKSKRSCK